MTIKQQLVEKLKKQLELETNARDLYKDFVKRIKDEEITKNINKIIDDEVGHMGVVEELIQIVESHEKPIQEKPETKKQGESIKEIFDRGNATLLLSKVEDYMHKVIMVLKELIHEKKIIYLSYNKVPKYIKKIFQEHGINVNDLIFINCANAESKGDINISPKNLTEIGITIPSVVSKNRNVALIVDTITGFSTYHSANTITQFVASINDRARNGDYRILWVAIDDPDEKSLNSKISQICDETIKV